MARLFDDGSSQYLSVASAPVTDYPFTLSAWANSNDDTIAQYVLSLGDLSEPDDFFVVRFVGNQGGDPVEFLRVSSGSASNCQATSGYTANTWHHLCAVGSASNDVAMFIDGGNKGTSNDDRAANNWDGCRIGTSADSTPSSYMSGAIAHAAIWNAALTDAEVAALAAGADPRTIRPESLAAYWPLVRTDQDIVGGYDMTATNNPTWADGPGAEMGPARVHVGLGAEEEPTYHIPVVMHHLRQQGVA